MAVDKVQTPFQIPPEALEDDDMELDEADLELEIVNPDAISIETDDGGMILDFTGGVSDALLGPDHTANLADFIDEDILESMASELVQEFEADRRSRKDWAAAYMKGLDLLGFKVEDRSQPWQGASGVFHPLLTEAVVRFQAQAMGEIFPASGPAKSKILGKLTPEKFKQAERVQNELNYQLTEEMTEYRDEMEQMLFRLPLAGSAFKKVYYDPIRERPVAMFVPVEDFVVSYGASDLQTCSRYTHVMKKDANEILKLQISGFYRDVDLPAPTADISDIQEKYDDLDGEEATLDDDDRHTLLEMHVDMNMPEGFDDPDGVARPYIITIDKSSRTVLSIRRNYDEDDPKKKKLMHFVHYKYLPGLGFYGTGLIHLIGGLAKSATSIMRQLIDAGTLSNLPGGLKARGMRIRGDDTPIMPGEFRDVDIPGGAIRDSITFLPYKEPSGVLYQLLGNVVEEGRRIGSVADIQVGNMNPEAPVGTTLALLERSLKVMSGVQARLHAAMKNELRLLARVIHDYMPAEYSYMEAEDGETFNRIEDFDGRVDVIPVSDPNAATMAQRVVQYQSALQLAQQAPQLYDMGKLHRQMLEVLGIQDADDIIKLPDDIKPADPVTENMAILKQEPVKAFAYQDHQAHIQVHMAMAQDPKIQQMVGQSPFAPAIMNAMSAHITEHIALQYRVEIQKRLGVELPNPEAPLPEDVELEVSRMAAMAADKLLKGNQAEAAQQQAQQQEQDPLTQIQRAELELKAREIKLKEDQAKHNAIMELERFKMDTAAKAGNLAVQQERLDADMQRDAANISARMATQLDANSRKEKTEGAKLGVKIATDLAKGANLGRTTTPSKEGD
jgi:hypothetical protein